MIVIYPMLTSENISPNVLPGIVKAIEKYILLYNTDAVLKAGGTGKAGRIISAGSRLAVSALMAGDNLSDNPGTSLSEMSDEDKAKLDDERAERKAKLDDERDKKKGKAKAAIDAVDIMTKGNDVRPSLDIPRGDAISLEPTWLQITTQKKGMQILGVKVVPFTLKEGTSMAQMMLDDKKLKYIQYLSKKLGRGFARIFYRIMRKIKIPFIKDRAISGDPRQDIIYAGSQHGKNVFLCINQLELDNNEIFSSPAGIQRLHKLGWASFIILDDVNRRATFCMKEFNGVCSVVPYGYMFSSMGKDHAKVYEDLEDLKKTSGPFFNMKTNRRRTFKENVSPVDKYLELIQK